MESERGGVPRYVFADAATRDYFQAILNQLKQNPKTIDAVQVLAPAIIRESLVQKFKTAPSPDAVWPSILQEISLTILLNATQFVPAVNGMHTITIPAIVSAYTILYPPTSTAKQTPTPSSSPTTSIATSSSLLTPTPVYDDTQCYPAGRVSGRELKYATAPPVTGPLPRTFLISGQSGVDHGPLRQMFNDLGFVEQILGAGKSKAREGLKSLLGNRHVGVLFLEQSYHYNPQEQLRYDPRTSELTCSIKSILPDDKRCIANKELLYQNMLEVAPDVAPHYLATTRNLKQVNVVNPGEVLILKPVGSSAGCGVGIKVVTTTAELRQVKPEILAAYPSGIASEYIQNPLLFNGKKFHLRMYLLVRGPINTPPRGGSISASKSSVPPHFEIFSRGKILTARDPYQMANFGNKNIHDSHRGSTDRNYFFPEDLIHTHTIAGSTYGNMAGVVDDLLAQMQQVAAIVGLVMEKKMRKWTYPESNFAYEVFGCDFLIQATDTPTGIQNRVVLLEINDRIANSSAFDGPDPPGWPPEERPGLFQWDLSPYVNAPFYQNIQEYAKFSALWWQWVLQQGIIPFYQFFEPISTHIETISRVNNPASQQGPPHTYMISGANGINHEPLRQILEGAGFTEIDITAPIQPIGFICQEQKLIHGRVQYDKRVYAFPSFLKSIINNQRYIVTDKASLYFQLQRVAPELTRKYMAETRLVSEIALVDHVLIVKPVSKPGQNIGGGQDISVVTSYPELKRVEADLLRKYQVEPIASEYIIDPWLVAGRKCHFRMYLLLRASGTSASGQPVPFLCQLWDVGTILTAYEQYIPADFGNPKIHDSHLKTTDRDRYFNLTDPNIADTGLSLEQRRHIFAQMEEIMYPVGQIMQTHTHPYPDSQNAYEVLGVDFMLRSSTMTVVLLEINNHVGIAPIDAVTNPQWNAETGPWSPNHTQFSTQYWTWLWNTAIAPYFM